MTPVMFKTLSLLIVLLYSLPINAQTITPSQSLQLVRGIVFLHQGESLRGYLFMRGDTLDVQSEEQRSVAYTDIRKIILLEQDSREPGFLYGTALASYLSYFVWNRTFSKGVYPTSGEFLYGKRGEEHLITMFLIVSGIATGGALGELFAPSSRNDHERELLFTGNADNDRLPWQTLQEYVHGQKKFQPSFHLSVQGTSVFMSLPELFFQSLASSGYKINYGYNDFSTLNVFRSIRFSYSLLNSLELGLARVSLSEHSKQFWGFGVRISPQTTTTVIDSLVDYSFTQGITSTAWYATVACRYSPLPWMYLSGGIGLGIASVTIKRSANIDIYTYQKFFFDRVILRNYNSRIEYSNDHLNTLFFGECTLLLRKGLSLGLYADYALLPSVEISGMPNLYYPIPSQVVRLGNGSIGFTLGLHF